MAPPACAAGTWVSVRKKPLTSAVLGDVRNASSLTTFAHRLRAQNLPVGASEPSMRARARAQRVRRVTRTLPRAARHGRQTRQRRRSRSPPRVACHTLHDGPPCTAFGPVRASALATIARQLRAGAALHLYGMVAVQECHLRRVGITAAAQRDNALAWHCRRRAQLAGRRCIAPLRREAEL